ncbi:MAG: glycosyltransferase family 4 protein [Arcobacteraceae bacterium]|jgi:glycosyltransferase involved in cell wall biosynthesis|nr:glycosyltransferase family 4 protein [Arcobacteraceae bacterium]
MSKKILIVSELFYPEEFKINEVALDWKNRGYEVDVLTMVPTYPVGEIYEGYENKWYQVELWNGITIHRIRSVTGYKISLFKKILKYFAFMIMGSIASLKIGKKYDYIFGFQVGSLTAMVPAVVLKQFYKKPTILWIQDIWPDSVYAYGFKKTKIMEFCIDRFVRYVYKYTTRFAISSKGFKEKIIPYLDNKKEILYAPNWSDELDKSLIPFEFNKDKKIHFTFTGNVGVVQNLENILEAWSRLDSSDLEKSQLNIIGDGSAINRLKNVVLEKKLENVIFWGRKPRVEIYKYLSASDFLIVSLIDNPIFALTVPAKTQTYIAVEKPILAILNGETANLIKENNLGFVTSPNDIEEIKKIFKKSINLDEKQKEEFKQNSNFLTNTIFNKKLIIDSLIDSVIKEEK